MQSRRVLVFNDPHLPFHDPLALNVMLFAAKSIEVHEIVINGDLLDFYSINMHQRNKHPDVNKTLEDELNVGREFLQKLRDTFPKAKITFIFGNHEDRLERYIVQECKWFHNIVRLEKQLQLEQLHIDWHPYNDAIELCKGLYVQHSPPSYGVNGARTSLLKKLDASYIWGCSHRQQHATTTGSRGKVYHGWFNGWLGSTTLTAEHKRVFSYAKGHESWQQCFMIVDIINDQFFGHQCSINNGMTTVDGQLFDVT